MPRSSPNNFSRKIRPYVLIIAVAIFVLAKFGGRLKEEYFSTADSKPSTTSQTKYKGRYEILENCQWIDDRGNDGDSFRVKYGKDEYTFRLYFADAPEKYLSDQHKDQRKRVAQQGQYFDGLSPQQTVEVGLQAQAFTAKQLKGKSFTVMTFWETVYGGDRFYAFILLPGSTDKKPLRLCEQLIKNGLARIHTKGPSRQSDYGTGLVQSGDSKKKPDQQEQGKGYLKRLHKLEAQAKKAKSGAWGMK